MRSKQPKARSRPIQLTIAFKASEETGATEGSQEQPGGAPDASETSLAIGKQRVVKRKWYSLIDKVYAQPNLQLAWEQVKANQGAPGVDGQSIRSFASDSKVRLEALSADLRAKTYRPQAVRRVYIPKAGGGQRPLGIPTVRDRIVQQALLQVLGPIFEAKFSDRSHGFRPERGCATALQVVDRAVRNGYDWVVDADIQGFFDNVDHELLLDFVNEEIADGSVLLLIRRILQAGVLQPDSGDVEPTELGTPQGGPLSPLLANIYLHRLDERMVQAKCGLVRYADDFVIFARSRSEAEAALELASEVLEGELKLTLHPEKTRVVAVDEGFEFLGFRYYRTKQGHRTKIVRSKSIPRFREAIRERTPRVRNQRKPKARRFSREHLAKNPRMREMVVRLNAYLRGWHWYFKGVWTPPYSAFNGFDEFVRSRVRLALTGRVGAGWWRRLITNHLLADLGLLSLCTLHADYRALHPLPSVRQD